MVGVDSDVDITGIEAVALRVPYGHKEGKDSEYQDNESNSKEFQENPPILFAEFDAVPCPAAKLASLGHPVNRPE